MKNFKVHIFWEGQKNMTKSPHFFIHTKLVISNKTWRSEKISLHFLKKATFSQIYGGDFAKIFDLLKIYEL